MTTTNFPKSVEAPIIRFFHTPVSWSKGVKNGGMTAVVKLPDSQNCGGWNDVLVYEPDSPGESWWDLVPRNTVIRVSIREVAKNKQDLIGFALPLKNQPSELQALIAEKLEVEEEKKEEITPEPSAADKLEEQLKADIEKKQTKELLKAYLPRLRYLVKRGEWVDKNESGLLLAQGTLAKAYYEWCEDTSPEADEMLVQASLDAVKYLIDTFAALRSAPHQSDNEPDGTLSVSCFHGHHKTVIDLKHLT